MHPPIVCHMRLSAPRCLHCPASSTNALENSQPKPAAN
ncbi:hypothetical protein M3J09_006756 [Ascochyta lentis]